MADLDAHLISPPDVHMGGELIDCYQCEREFELPATHCPHCGVEVDHDSIRDQLEAKNEPPEWA